MAGKWPWRDSANLCACSTCPAGRANCALILLTDYLGDPARAEDLHQEFASLTIDRFTEDWELSASDIENAIMEVEILRARWRIALMRG